MDLVRGICFFCSNSKVVSDTQNVQNTIITLFTGSDINEEKLLALRPPRVCHLCYHSFVLMKRTHDDILHSSSAEKVHENCHLCGNSEDVIKVLKWKHFEIIGKDYRGLIGNSISNACSDCLYYLETKNAVKDKLIAAIPQLNQVSDFASDITNHSTPLRRTRTKAERKVPVEIIDLTEKNTDLDKFKPLRNDTKLKKTKLISADPKLMNQILIIKLQNLNNSLERSCEAVKKRSPQKRVRFKDIHELEEDICSMPRKINYKETRYHDNLTHDTDKNSDKEDELVEYEIKTSPRRSRYRDYRDDDDSSDTPDGRKKSFFKIKLTKKKPNTFPLKPALIKPPFKSSLVSKPPTTKFIVKNTSKHPPKSKAIRSKKKRPVAKSKKNPVITPVISSKTRAAKNYFKNNLVINVERMKFSETNGVEDEEEEEVELEIENEDFIESEDISDPLRIDNFENNVVEENNCSDQIMNSQEDKTENESSILQDDIVCDTNGYIEEEETDCEITNTKEIISISSEDASQPDDHEENKDNEKIENVEETVDEIKLYLLNNSNGVKINEKEEKQLVNELDKTNDSKENNEEFNTSNEEEVENSNKEDEIVNILQFEPEVKDGHDVYVEQNKEDFNETRETESQIDTITNSQDEEETENSQEEDRTENNQEQENSQESQEETSQEDKISSQAEWTDENSMEGIQLSIEDVDDENLEATAESCETVSEVDKKDDEIADNENIRKRKRDEDSLSDSNSLDKKRKKVSFSVDQNSD